MNWKQRIAKAKQSGGFSEEDSNTALSWKTCAVSEHPLFLKHDLDKDDNNTIGSKVTGNMFNLGIDFAYNVHIQNIEYAEVLYNNIQKTRKLVK